MITLHYMLAGLGWSPNYTLRLAAGGAAKLVLAATIRNKGPALKGARLKLVSGLVKADLGGRFGGYLGGGGLGPVNDWSDLESYFQYHLAGVLKGALPPPPQPGDIQDIADLANQNIGEDSTVTLPALTVPVSVTRQYLWYATPGDGPAGGAAQRVLGIYRFVNAAHEPLAEGAIHVEQAAMAVGTAFVGFTPPGQEATVVLGGAKGIVVKRSVEQSPVPATWATKHAVDLHVENRSGAKVKVAVVDSPGGSDDSWPGNGAQTVNYQTQPDRLAGEAVVWNVQIAPAAPCDLRYSYSVPLDTSKTTVLSFSCDGGPTEAQYLKRQQDTITNTNGWRQAEAHGYALYALPIPANISHADLDATVSDNARIGLAPDDGGKPGKFVPVMDAVAMRGNINFGYSRGTECYFSIDHFLAAGRTVWVKVENAAGVSSAWAGVRRMEVESIPPGYKSRGQVYATGSSGSGVAGVSAGFQDRLTGKTVGVARKGDQYFYWTRNGATLLLPGSWIKYTNPDEQLPADRGALTFSLYLYKGFRPGVVVSDALPKADGTTYPALAVQAQRVDDTHFRLSLGFLDPPQGGKWETIAAKDSFDTGKWYVVCANWGPKGRNLCVNGKVLAHSDFAGPLRAATPKPLCWGLGAVFDKTARSDDPAAGEATACPMCSGNVEVIHNQADRSGAWSVR